MRTAIWWIRRDLRLHDAPALAAARRAARWVVPVFILDPELLASSYMAEARTAFLFEGLRRLDEALRARGGRLVVRRGPPRRELSRLVSESGAGAVYVEQDVSPYARRRDREIAQELPLKGVWGLGFLSPMHARKPDGEPYTRFTPYRRAWMRDAAERPRSVLRAPARWPSPEGLKDLESLAIPEAPRLPRGCDFVAGERAARARLRGFLRRDVSLYGERRDRLDLDGTSRLSPYLRFGMLSPRAAVAAAFDAVDGADSKRARAGAETWLSELVWREFYLSILYHFPRVRRESFTDTGRFVSWRNREEDFQAWCEGETGYPVVDAAMRQLRETGWMHNRARMIVASFLTKHLLVDWRWGERFFMQRLLDGDPSANNGGWQWTAGTGTDAAPYFRIFHPVRQGRRFDPEGLYVRRFVPELEAVSPEARHAPWESEESARAARSAGYPEPIVAHLTARVRALRAFEDARERARA